MSSEESKRALPNCGDCSYLGPRIHEERKVGERLGTSLHVERTLTRAPLDCRRYLDSGKAPGDDTVLRCEPAQASSGSLEYTQRHQGRGIPVTHCYLTRSARSSSRALLTGFLLRGSRRAQKFFGAG